MNAEWLAPDFDGILPELKQVNNWVLTKPELRNGKITKRPFQPNGRLASTCQPATWSSFDAVKEACEGGGFKAVGFVLDGRPHFDGLYLHGFDWDDCVNDGRIDGRVKAIVDTLQIPRLEQSVSGTGLRGFFLHSELLPSLRTQIDGRSVEMYSDKRYLTTTGRRVGRLR